MEFGISEFGRIIPVTFMTDHFKGHEQNEDKPEIDMWYQYRKWIYCARGSKIRINCGMRTNQRRHEAIEDDITYTVQWSINYLVVQLGLGQNSAKLFALTSRTPARFLVLVDFDLVPWLSFKFEEDPFRSCWDIQLWIFGGSLLLEVVFISKVLDFCLVPWAKFQIWGRFDQWLLKIFNF